MLLLPMVAGSSSSRFRRLTNPNLTYLSGLRTAVLGLLSDSIQSNEVSHLVSLVHSMSIVILRHKRQADFVAQLGGITDSDLAMDCIADLFRRDEKGSYVALNAYFSSLSIADADDEELAVHLRRLVSSAVNQGIFRLLGDLDPGLSKIIRNIKAGVASLKIFDEMEVRGEGCISPVLVDPLLCLSFMSRDELVSQLVLSLHGRERTPDLLAALACVLRNQSECTRAIPVVRAALAFREVLALKEMDNPQVAHIAEPSREKELRLAVDQACLEVYNQVAPKYLKTKGVPQGYLDSYFRAVRFFMMSRLDGKGEEPTLFESLRATGCKIAHDEYRRSHRQRLEYVAHLVQKRAKKVVGR